jgi:cytidine deaminase
MAPESAVYRSLVESARAQLPHSYAPKSQFRVGVALLCEDGTVVTGCNIEGLPTALSSCAERTTMDKAITQGLAQFKAIAIVAASGKLCWPCGGCRQKLFHHAPALDVIIEGEHGELVVHNLRELLPQYNSNPASMPG